MARSHLLSAAILPQAQGLYQHQVFFPCSDSCLFEVISHLTI
jgi:hypothetical protein